jgi:hypothetical protein
MVKNKINKSTCCVVVAGLLQYLCKVVREQPLENLDQVFYQVISPHALLVLAQSSCAAIRIAVVQVSGMFIFVVNKNVGNTLVQSDLLCGHSVFVPLQHIPY